MGINIFTKFKSLLNITLLCLFSILSLFNYSLAQASIYINHEPEEAIFSISNDAESEPNTSPTDENNDDNAESGNTEDLTGPEVDLDQTSPIEPFTPEIDQVSIVPPTDQGTTLLNPNLNDLISYGLIRYGVREECQNLGKCSTTDILQVISNIGTVILGISGSVFLLMFVLGGMTWMLSGGSDTAIKKGLDTMRDATIGLILIFSAYLIVNTLISVLALGRIPTSNLEGTLKEVTGQEAQIQSQ